MMSSGIACRSPGEIRPPPRCSFECRRNSAEPALPLSHFSIFPLFTIFLFFSFLSPFPSFPIVPLFLFASFPLSLFSFFIIAFFPFLLIFDDYILLFSYSMPYPYPTMAHLSSRRKRHQTICRARGLCQISIESLLLLDGDIDIHHHSYRVMTSPAYARNSSEKRWVHQEFLGTTSGEARLPHGNTWTLSMRSHQQKNLKETFKGFSMI